MELMREPDWCDDLIDVRLAAPLEPVFDRLRRPVGGLILRRTEIPIVQACFKQLRDCATGQCETTSLRCAAIGHALGPSLTQDLKGAQDRFDIAATHGDSWSARQAAAMSWHMGVRARDDFNRRLERLVAQGDSLAARLRGMLLVQDTTRMGRNEALAWFARSAAMQDPQGMCAVAVMKATGPVASRDYATSLRLLERAAAKGDPDALSNLGLFHELGRGTPIDHRRAVQFYDQASKLNSISGHRNLGIALEHGIGIAQDTERAIMLFRAAAVGGDVIARHKLRMSAIQGAPLQ